MTVEQICRAAMAAFGALLLGARGWADLSQDERWATEARAEAYIFGGVTARQIHARGHVAAGLPPYDELQPVVRLGHTIQEAMCDALAPYLAPDTKPLRLPYREADPVTALRDTITGGVTH